jgi:hypothetical protein
MLLQDAVAAAQPLVISTSDGRHHLLQGARDLRSSLLRAPLRFVLDDNAAALVSQTAFARPSPLENSLDLVRAPALSLWVEWNEAGRCNMLEELGLHNSMHGRESARKRAGAFVTADQSGRRGVIAPAWESPDGTVDCSPFTISFDLDVPFFRDTPGPTKHSRKIHMQRHTWLQPLFDCARFDLSDDWREYYLRYTHTREEFEKALNRSVEVISSDMPIIMAFFLVFSARGALRQDPVAYDRLNEARQKRGKPALLNHLSVSLDIGEEELTNGHGHLNARGETRLHHVCGHLVRRQNSIFWRRAHLRGNPQLGFISSRTVDVKANPVTADTSA